MTNHEVYKVNFKNKKYKSIYTGILRSISLLDKNSFLILEQERTKKEPTHSILKLINIKTKKEKQLLKINGSLNTVVDYSNNKILLVDVENNIVRVYKLK